MFIMPGHKVIVYIKTEQGYPFISIWYIKHVTAEVSVRGEWQPLGGIFLHDFYFEVAFVTF